jgi:hypothetical protein
VRHFIQYHNTQRFGLPGEHQPGDPYWIATSKSPLRLPGNTIWLVMGEGTPRNYILYEVFMADWIEPASGVDFLYYIGGLKGLRLEPAIELNAIPWFRNMKRSLGNFSLGLTEITQTYASLLIPLARANSLDYVRAENMGWFGAE